MSANTFSNHRWSMHKMLIHKLPQMFRQWPVLHLCVWLQSSEWCLPKFLPIRVPDKWDTLCGGACKYALVWKQQHVPCAVYYWHKRCTYCMLDVETSKWQDFLTRGNFFINWDHLDWGSPILYLPLLQSILYWLSDRNVCSFSSFGLIVHFEYFLYRTVCNLMLW